MMFRFKHLNVNTFFGVQHQPLKIKKMKLIITALLVAFAFVSGASAQVVITSYADVFTVTADRLSVLNDERKIEDTAVGAVPAGSGGFATRIVFPEGTTSAVFTSASYTRVSKTSGSEVMASPGVVNMSGSQFNPEGDGSTPSIFYRNSGGSVIVPSGTFVGTTISNPRTVFITEQRAATLPALVQVGDYWEFRRTLSGTYVLEGSVIPFSVTSQPARVIVVNETDAPVSSVSQDQTTNVMMGQPVISGEDVEISATGSNLTPSNYNSSWWIETSVNLVEWSPSENATVSPGTTVLIKFPYDDEEQRRFWRIRTFSP